MYIGQALFLYLILHYPPMCLLLGGPACWCSTSKKSFPRFSLKQSLESTGMIPLVGLPFLMKIGDMTGFQGLEFISQLIIDDEEMSSILMSISNKSVNTFKTPSNDKECLLTIQRPTRCFALCSAAALFKYIQAKLNSVYSPKSLRIQYKVVEGTSRTKF